ncbi:MAG: WYL domain-containing protein [Lentisphaeraceae bacterium]|nr:WYL domain-containing protein [Lentisphaeraceae bacterium]
MKANDRQLRRLVRFIDEVKKDRYPNAIKFAKILADQDLTYGTDLTCCSKTIKRDIEYLKNTIGAPLEYDRSEHGYFLYMKDWTFPELSLGGDELFAELFVRHLSRDTVLPSLKEHLETGWDVQITSSPDKDTNISALNSVIYATGRNVAIDEEVSRNILHSWKECFSVEAIYVKNKQETPFTRKLDIHALFLSERVWYCRAYCHTRAGFRNFALHKFKSVDILKKRFRRSKKVINELKSGKLFDFKTINTVSVLCTPNIADYINDREWFPNQSTKLLKDGSLKVTLKDVPSQAVKSWVMSFSGNMEVLAPKKLRKEIYDASLKLMEKHK